MNFSHNSRMAEEICITFHDIIVCQFCISALEICVSVYQLSVRTTNAVEIVTYLLYLMCMLGQFFVYCYFGNEVSLQVSAPINSELTNEFRFISVSSNTCVSFSRVKILAVQFLAQTGLHCRSRRRKIWRSWYSAHPGPSECHAVHSCIWPWNHSLKLVFSKLSVRICKAYSYFIGINYLHYWLVFSTYYKIRISLNIQRLFTKSNIHIFLIYFVFPDRENIIFGL